MEKFALTLQSLSDLGAYMANGYHNRSEKEILAEIAAVIADGDAERLAWFAGFGDSLRQISMNVSEYRQGLEFGFTEVAFNQYGWLVSPTFLDREDIKLEQSSIRIGRGPNGIWAYALRMTYGSAGCSGPLCVFCKKFHSRDAALSAALDEMKVSMLKYLGNTDTTNYKQDVLEKTLKAIAVQQIGRVQLVLF